MSNEFDKASFCLSEDITIAIETQDDELIKSIRKYWDNESWNSIQRKFNTEGSTWYVWWQDGVNNYMRDIK